MSPIDKGYYEKELEAKVKREKKKGNLENIPIHLRKSVTEYTLNKYPQYRDLFFRCTSCDKMSLKPVDRFIDPKVLKENARNIKRKCTLCGYIHDPTYIEKIRW